LQKQQQVAIAAVLATLQHNKQHKVMMVTASSGCKGAVMLQGLQQQIKN